MLLDRIEYDVDRMRLFNAILESGVRTYGPDFLDCINEPIVAQRNTPVPHRAQLHAAPVEGSGRAGGRVPARTRRASHGLRDWLSRNVVRYAGRGALGEADLLSYLFFDRCYADHLIELGRLDAESAAEDLVEFFLSRCHVPRAY